MAIHLGLPMIGSYTNVVLYQLELIEAYIYYFASQRSMQDHVFLKCVVAFSLVIDTIGTIGVCTLIAVETRAFNDIVTPGRLYWAFQMYITANMSNAFIFQTFMVHRYWQLSRNRIVSLFISLLILASLGTTMSVLARNQAIVSKELFKTNDVHVLELSMIMVLTTAMLTDISITTALLWQLHRSKVFTGANLPLAARRLVARVSSQAIKTGIVPCAFALITLVSYVAYINQNIATCFACMLGRVYTSTMLFALINRDKLRDGGDWVDRNDLTLATVDPDAKLDLPEKA